MRYLEAAQEKGKCSFMNLTGGLPPEPPKGPVMKVKCSQIQGLDVSAVEEPNEGLGVDPSGAQQLGRMNRMEQPAALPDLRMEQPAALPEPRMEQRPLQSQNQSLARRRAKYSESLLSELKNTSNQAEEQKRAATAERARVEPDRKPSQGSLAKSCLRRNWIRALRRISDLWFSWFLRSEIRLKALNQPLRRQDVAEIQEPRVRRLKLGKPLLLF